MTRFFSRSVLGYGVVMTNYVQVLEEPERGSASFGFLRTGTLVEALERRRVKNGEEWETWILVRAGGGEGSGEYRGWLPEDALRVYTRLEQAKTAAEGMPK